MKTHIPTLLLREWMQHKRGWLIAALAPPLLFLALLPFGQVEGLPTDRLGSDFVALGVVMLSACVCFVIALLLALFQLPGLTRRDVQDRSVEFWLSLPGRPSESVAATVVAHAWLAPVGALLIGAVFGPLIGLGLLAKHAGVGAAFDVQWFQVIATALPLLLRALAGTVLLMLWLAPVIFVLMAASAWLKRLGVPVVLVGGAVVLSVLYKAYDVSWPLDTLQALAVRINETLVHDERAVAELLHKGGNLWMGVLRDFGLSVASLASLQFIGWAAVAAAGFALVVAKRSRGG